MKQAELKELETAASIALGQSVSITRTLHGTWMISVGGRGARTCATASHAAEFIAGAMYQKAQTEEPVQ